MKLDAKEQSERPCCGVLKVSPRRPNLKITNLGQDVIDHSGHGELEFVLTICVFCSLHNHQFCETEVERNISLDLGRKVQPKFTGHRGSKNLFSPEKQKSRDRFRTPRHPSNLKFHREFATCLPWAILRIPFSSRIYALIFPEFFNAGRKSDLVL
jgi:hypothetical protein